MFQCRSLLWQTLCVLEIPIQKNLPSHKCYSAGVSIQQGWVSSDSWKAEAWLSCLNSIMRSATSACSHKAWGQYKSGITRCHWCYSTCCTGSILAWDVCWDSWGMLAITCLWVSSLFGSQAMWHEPWGSWTEKTVLYGSVGQDSRCPCNDVCHKQGKFPFIFKEHWDSDLLKKGAAHVFLLSTLLWPV